MNRAGKMQKISGNTILTGAANAFSWARWRRLTRISSAWTLQHSSDSDTKSLGLHHRQKERPKLIEVGPLHEMPHGVATAHAYPGFLQHPEELFGQRSGNGGNHPGQS